MTGSHFDTNKKFVRVLETSRPGMVEFEFAIGEPDLFVELIMPEAAFAEFCRTNEVTFINGPRASTDMDWRLRDATTQRLDRTRTGSGQN